jgi:hypothetical protein
MKHTKNPELGFFDGRLIASPVGKREGRPLWEIQFPFSFHSRRYECVCHIEKGFITDFGSVPRAPVLWLLFSDEGMEACATHDKLWDDPGIPRKVSNLIFYDALLVCGVARWRAKAMFYAVELSRKLKGG